MTKKNTRRKFSAKLKFQIVLEAARGERPIAELFETPAAENFSGPPNETVR
ncbi:MAG: hypothetical protein ACYDET_01240 [Thermoleophilia bacterium]